MSQQQHHQITSSSTSPTPSHPQPPPPPPHPPPTSPLPPLPSTCSKSFPSTCLPLPSNSSTLNTSNVMMTSMPSTPPSMHPLSSSSPSNTMTHQNANTTTTTTTSPPPPARAPSSDGGGSHGLATSTTRITSKELEVIEAPSNFSLVEPFLYRSSLPCGTNVSFLKSLGLRTAIILSSEKPGRNVTALFTSTLGTRIIHTGLHGWSIEKTSWKPMSDEVVKETVELILHKEHHPMLLCDIGGVYHVGMVVACLRKLQGWNLTSVINEYRSFAATRSRYVNEQFIELFDTDLITIPQFNLLPYWFADGLEIDRKEALEFHTLLTTGKLDDCGTLIIPKTDAITTTCTTTTKTNNNTNTTNNNNNSNNNQTQNQNQKQQNIPKYLLYYYSSACPLNSDLSVRKQPRIQTL